ncbi:terminase small subunit [Neisseria cinerea]
MTPKQEHFTRLYVETGNASEAYHQAYNAENMKPETVTNEAYKLLQSPDISAMVDDLKAEAQQRHMVTVDDLLHELEQARVAALASPTPQSSAAVSATMGKAKMLGLLVDKAEIKAEAEIQEKPKSRIESIVDSLTEEENKAILDLALKTDGGKWDAVTLVDLAAVTGKDPDKVYFAVLLVTALDKI